jgi:DNA-binding MarR family transcriptional regulator
MAKTEASSIVFALERLSRLMRAAEFGNGLNPAQWVALRFLARANRFSNSPGALTRYLGATKGTISQTVKALERKKLIEKSGRPGEKRSVVLRLTQAGRSMMTRDPWSAIAESCDALGGKTRRRMDRGLADVLAQEITRRLAPSFGRCATCRFWRAEARVDDVLGPHLCMLYDEPLSETETAQICIAHEPAN